MKNQYSVTVDAGVIVETYTLFSDNPRNAEVLAHKRFNREWPTLDVDHIHSALR